jgi:hypothetical protein
MLLLFHAVLSILGPLRESQMWSAVDEIAPPSSSPSGTHIRGDLDLVFLIDELEQHLHPELQGAALRHSYSAKPSFTDEVPGIWLSEI